MTDEQLALLIDPNKKKPWWEIDRYWCPKRERWVEIGDARLYGFPPLTTDRVAAFTHVAPVLEEAGCKIVLEGGNAEVWLKVDFGYGAISDIEPLPAATTAAIAWLAEHEPERLRKAVEGVKRLTHFCPRTAC